MSLVAPEHRLVSIDALDRYFAAGAAIAARSLKYPAAARLILEEGLGAERVVRFFSSSASKTWRKDSALIILTGSVARYRARREGWTPEPVASLARGLIGDDFGGASDTATRIVREHWPAIEALAHGAA